MVLIEKLNILYKAAHSKIRHFENRKKVRGLWSNREIENFD